VGVDADIQTVGGPRRLWWWPLGGLLATRLDVAAGSASFFGPAFSIKIAHIRISTSKRFLRSVLSDKKIAYHSTILVAHFRACPICIGTQAVHSPARIFTAACAKSNRLLHTA